MSGHLLFVPKENNTKFITITLQATVQYGEKLVEEGKIDGYHFGMNMREPRTICNGPIFILCPRKEGDVEGFPGSVRFAVRNGRGPSYYLNHQNIKKNIQSYINTY